MCRRRLRPAIRAAQSAGVAAMATALVVTLGALVVDAATPELPERTPGASAGAVAGEQLTEDHDPATLYCRNWAQLIADGGQDFDDQTGVIYAYEGHQITEAERTTCLAGFRELAPDQQLDLLHNIASTTPAER